MVKIEKAIKTSDSLRGILYIKNEKTERYEDEMGEMDIFNSEGNEYDVYLYIAAKYKEVMKLEDTGITDKLNLEEKIREFIWDSYYEPAEIKLVMNISFLSELPSINYEA